MPNGGTSTREIVEHPGAVAVVALDADGSVYLVRQWRHAIGELTLEIPAGVVGCGEDPLAAVRRELAEETGLAAESITHLIDIRVSVGYSNELIRIFLARGLSPTRSARDDDENLEVVRLPLEEAVGLCLRGTISDAKCIAGLLALRSLPVSPPAETGDDR